MLIVAVGSVTGVASPAQADSIRDKQWHLDFLRAAQLHKITKGKGTVVAVVDSGVDGAHADLAGNVIDGRDFTGNGDAREDADGHGTAMASLIAGHGHGPGNRDGVLGLAPEASILPVRDRVKRKVGRRYHRTDQGIGWAVERGAGVMNLSFGGAGSYSQIENAFTNDVVVVSSAGNTEQGGSTVSAPASYPGVIAVSGVDRTGEFSSKSARGPEVVLAAPMVDITGAWAGKGGRYSTATGTSGAAAIVSGVAALIRAKYPDISANGVIDRLIKTADDKGPPGRDDKYGFGVVNPLKALTADIPDIGYNPLIEGTDPSPSPSATTAPPAKAAGGNTEAPGYLLPTLAGTAALVILAGLGIYFLNLARRNRRPQALGRGQFHGGPPPGYPSGVGPPDSLAVQRPYHVGQPHSSLDTDRGDPRGSPPPNPPTAGNSRPGNN